MILQNTLWLSLSFIIGRVLANLWQLYLARYYTNNPDLYGYYMLLLTQYSIWTILAEGGFIYAIQQFIAIDRNIIDNKIGGYWSLIVGARILFSIASGIGFVFIITLKYPEQFLNVFLLSVTLIISSIGTAPFALWAGLGDFEIEAKSGILTTSIFVSLAFVATLFTNNITLIILSTFIANLVSSIYIWRKAITKWGFPKDIVTSIKSYLSKLLRLSLPLTLSNFAFVFFFKGDMLTVTEKFGPKFAGIYSISIMIFFLILDLMWGQFGKAYTPVLLGQWNSYTNKTNIIKQLKRVLSFYAFISLILLVCIVFFSKRLLTIVLGSNSPWLYATEPLSFLSIGLLPQVCYAIGYRLLLLEKGSTFYMTASLVIVVLKFFVVKTFIKTLGLNGLALLNSVIMMLFYHVLAFPLSPEGKSLFFNFKLIGYFILSGILIFLVAGGKL